MSMIESILVPLDGSAVSARSLGCVMWLAGRLDASVHLLSAGRAELPVHDALRRLQVPEVFWSSVTLHRTDQPPEQGVLDAVEAYGVGLVVMTARGAAADRPLPPDDPLSELGHVTRWIAERCSVPVMVVPMSYEERLPWTRALVPVSGEAEADEVLDLAVRLSHAVGMVVTAVHVVEDDGASGLAAHARYADAPHHEYPSRLQSLVERGLPDSTASETGCIDDVVLSRGDVADELLALVHDREADLLIIGWHGTFLAGHAGILRTLLRDASCPILLMKPAPRATFRLKVGEEIE